MNPERIVGSIVTATEVEPFVLHTGPGTLERGTYATPDPAQAGLSIIQQQRVAQVVGELANVAFSQVRVGKYRCSSCGKWIDAAAPGAWSVSICMSCSLDRGTELHEHYAARAAVGRPDPSFTSLPDEEASRVIEATLRGDGSESLVERAVAVALEAHRGQLDKAGAPYLLHPLRMMLRMDTPETMMAAVLHDVVEDADWTFDGLRAEGFPEDVVLAIEHLTRRKGETYEAFIERAAKHPLARRVKLADLEDNMDVRRLDALTKANVDRLARYLKARRRLLEEG